MFNTYTHQATGTKVKAMDCIQGVLVNPEFYSAADLQNSLSGNPKGWGFLVAKPEGKGRAERFPFVYSESATAHWSIDPSDGEYQKQFGHGSCRDVTDAVKRVLDRDSSALDRFI